jgi:PTH1 family peptidyl-tRNA hydrolase
MHFLKRFKLSATETSPETATLIVGLGNPGREYASNRHNVGFMTADRWAAAHTLTFNKIQHHAIIAIGRSGEQRGARRVIVAKPQTYMNESGRAVGGLLRFYKIPVEQLLVIFDDLDLPFGTIRLRADGGAGGHNGMRSIIQHLGGDHFARLRIGIGRPPGRMDPAAFVLQDFNRDEAAELDALLDRAGQAIDMFLTAGITAAMNQFNTNLPRDRTV